MPEMMRAMLLTGFGGLDKLQLAHVPRPQPAADEVLIRVGACGLNNTDLNLRKAWYSKVDETGKQTGWQQTAPAFPIIQGADIVGEIIVVGSDVADERIGQRVLVNPTLYKVADDNPMAIDFIGSERAGGFAEYVCVPAKNAYALQSSLTDAELATFATSYLTAYHMLQRADLQSGETILITGASGGVGSALVQLARVRNAHIVAVVGQGKSELVRELGANRVLIRGHDDLVAALSDTSIEVVADVVGGAGVNTLIDVIGEGGRIVTCGAIAGAIVEIDLRKLYLRHLSLLGATLGTASEFAALVEIIQANQIKPVLAATYALDDLPAAQNAFEQKQYVGKIVIVP